MSKRKRKRAEKPLPDVVPFNKAVKVITRQPRRLERALERFKVLPHLSTEELLRQKPATRAVMKQWREQIIRWRKYGMKRDEVIWRRSLYNEKDYRRYREATAGSAKERRKPWSKQRLEKSLEKNWRRPRKKRPPS
jgi:hypothetical protein